MDLEMNKYKEQAEEMKRKLVGLLYVAPGTSAPDNLSGLDVI